MKAPSVYTIGQLAELGGVPVTTLRYYERTGLLRPQARTGSNYRMYTAAGLQRLRFIRAAQSAGLSLDDVAGLIRLSDTRETPCAQVQQILRARLGEIEQRMRELSNVKAAVASALRACRCAPRGGLCADIDRLAKKTA